MNCATCTTPDTCSATGTCAIDPASSWRVHVSRLVLEDEWDDNSLPDPFIQLWCPSTATSVTSTQPTVSNTTVATWTTSNCVVTAAQLFSSGFDFAVMEEDFAFNDTIQGRTRVTVQPTHLRNGSFVGSSANIVSITFTFTKQ